MNFSTLARALRQCVLQASRPRGGTRLDRGAFTLIEILVALVITLIMMGAVVTLFGVVTDSVSGSRALLETSDRLRACRNRIALDLQGATVTPSPPRRPENDEGYLEIVEGPYTDYYNNGYTAVNPASGGDTYVSFASLFGDTDDALLLTTRSRGEPFIGKANGNIITSQVAEVAYFVRKDGLTIGLDGNNNPVQLYTLYRRCMLVLPSGGIALGTQTGPAFYNSYDVSAHIDSNTSAPVANSLGDLTKPENRFGRKTGGWPNMAQFNSTGQTGFDNTTGRQGDDILMTNVLAFDVQVYDPKAPIYVVNSVALEPRDPGYANQLQAGSSVTTGGYADLGYMFNKSYLGGNPPVLADRPNSKSGYSASGTPRPPFVYDTWSMHYEADGVQQYATVADAMTNGLDDDTSGAGFGIVDDQGEADTLAPYPTPLRGLRITIRVYEPGSQQIRQVTVVQDFLQD